MSKNAVAVWDFTISSDKADLDQILSKCKEYCKKWCFQLEQGSETGFEHYQGRVSLKTRSRNIPPFGFGHWSVTSSENQSNSFYCMKEETRIKGPWTDSDPYIPRQSRGIKLLKWQQQVADSADVWDTRHIDVIIDTNGNIGKSTLITYLGCRGLARRIPPLESYQDFMAMVLDTPKSRLYLVDFPRALTKGNSHCFWGALETVKDGFAFDKRYHYREAYFDSPNIWVFANHLPDTSMLSKDRWRFWRIKNGELSLCNNTFLIEGAGTTDTPTLGDLDYVPPGDRVKELLISPS